MISATLALAYLIAAAHRLERRASQSKTIPTTGFLILFPALIGAHQYLQWGIFIPTQRQAAEKVNQERRQQQFASTTKLSIGDTAP